MTTAEARRQAFHAALLAADSATAILERAFGSPVTIHRTAPDSLGADAVRADLLSVSGHEVVTWRQVQLRLGPRHLSQADLWYVPTRLPAGMARDLSLTSQPFGNIVRSLRLRRMTLSARTCAAGEAYALEHRALLTDSSGAPMALVEECYHWGLFASS